MSIDRPRWIKWLKRMVIIALVMVFLSLIAFFFGWRYIKKTYGIEYADMHFTYPSKLAFEDLSWDVDSVSSGRAEYLLLDWSWMSLVGKKIHVQNLEIRSAEILVQAPKSKNTEPVDLPRIDIDLVDLDQVNIQYSDQKQQAQLTLPQLSLTNANYSKKKGWRYKSFAFSDLTAKYSSDSLQFTNDTLPISLDSEEFSFVKNQVNFNFLGLAAGRETVRLGSTFARVDSLFGVKTSLDSLDLSFGFIRQWYPDLSIFVNPEFPDQERIQLTGNVAYQGDSIQFDGCNLKFIDASEIDFGGYIDIGSPAVPLDIFVANLKTSRPELIRFLRPRSFDSMYQWPSTAEGPVHVYGDAAHISIKGSLATPEGDLESTTFIEMEDPENIFYSIGIKSDALALDQIIDYMPISVPNAQVDLLMEGLYSYTPGVDTFRLHATSEQLVLEGYELGGLSFDYFYNADYDSLWATVAHPAVEADFKGDIVKTHPDTSAVRWSGRIGQIKPALLQAGIPGWTLKSDYHGAYYYGAYAFSKTEFGLNDPRFVWAEGDSTLARDFDLSYIIDGPYNELKAKTNKEDELLAFYEGSTPSWGNDWRASLDAMPELGVYFTGDIDSAFVKRFSGFEAGATIEKFDLKHEAEAREWTLQLDVPEGAYGTYAAHGIQGDIHYQFRHFDGTLSSKSFSGSGVEGKDLSVLIERGSDEVNWEMILGDINGLGSSQIAVRQYNEKEGYRIAFTPDKPIRVAGNTWVATDERGFVFDRDFNLKHGEVELRSGRSKVQCSGDSTGVLALLVDSVDLQSITKPLIRDTTFHGIVRVGADLDISTYHAQVELDLFDFGTDTLDLGHWYAKGSYGDSLQLHLLFDKALSNSFADIVVTSEDMHFTAEVLDFDLTVLQQGFLPPNIGLKGILSGAVVGYYTDDLYADGWLNIQDGSLSVPGVETPYHFKGDSLHFVDDHLEFHDFHVYDEQDRPLVVDGLLNTIPTLWYDLKVRSEAFTFLDSPKGGLISGKAFGTVDAELRGTNERLFAKGSMGLLPGSYIRHQLANDISIDRADRVVRFTSFKSEEDSIVVAEKEPEMEMELDLEIKVEDSDFDIVINPISQEYVRMLANGQLSITKSLYGDPEVFGSMEGTSGRAYISLPVVPSINMDIQQAKAAWTGRYDEPLISFRGTEEFNTSIEGIPQFENRVGLVPVTLELKISDATIGEMDVVLDVTTDDPELDSYLGSLPADQRMSLATNLLLFGTIMPNGQSGTNMAMGAAAAKLNELAHRNFENADLNFAMTSAKEYDEFGMEQEATRLNYSFRKGFFGNRLYVSVGGDLGISSLEADGYRPPSHYIGNVALNYRLAEGSPWTLRGARTESYEGVIDGELTKYSIGLGFYKSYPTFWSIFGIKSEEKMEVEP